MRGAQRCPPDFPAGRGPGPSPGPGPRPGAESPRRASAGQGTGPYASRPPGGNSSAGTKSSKGTQPLGARPPRNTGACSHAPRRQRPGGGRPGPALPAPPLPLGREAAGEAPQPRALPAASFFFSSLSSSLRLLLGERLPQCRLCAAPTPPLPHCTKGRRGRGLAQCSLLRTFRGSCDTSVTLHPEVNASGWDEAPV